STRVQLKAFAAGTAETASQARRLSLSRALAVRSFLIDKGVESTRMDVRALGTNFEEGPADRVDIQIVKR
ncbi:MAG: OmpA family protein, partial [Alphaproteobacteria bacterium]|nr:OmpA family protein [Alphaproteobacteria bacterium]